MVRCYTVDPKHEWDCCDVGKPSDHCVWPPSPPPPPSPSPLSPPPAPNPLPPPPSPGPPSPPLGLKDIECYTDHQARDYRGHQNTTSRGFSCQKWTDQTPHAHDYSPAKYARHGVGDHNYCRAIGSFCAWCYTAQEGKPEWDCCDVGQPQTYCEILNSLLADDEAFAQGDTGPVAGDEPLPFPAHHLAGLVTLAVAGAGSLWALAARWDRAARREPRGGGSPPPRLPVLL